MNRIKHILLTLLLLLPGILTQAAPLRTPIFQKTHIGAVTPNTPESHQKPSLLAAETHQVTSSYLQYNAPDSPLAPKGGVRVGSGQASWTAPNGKVFHDQATYVKYMKHRHKSMKYSRIGRNAHKADDIRAAGFNPSDVKLSEGARNFIPEAVEDLVGNPHLFELKTSGYYSASFSNNIYPAAIYAGRNGLPFTLKLHNSAQLSQPLNRLVLSVQKRFGGSIIRYP